MNIRLVKTTIFMKYYQVRDHPFNGFTMLMFMELTRDNEYFELYLVHLYYLHGKIHLLVNYFFALLTKGVYHYMWSSCQAVKWYLKYFYKLYVKMKRLRKLNLHWSSIPVMNNEYFPTIYAWVIYEVIFFDIRKPMRAINNLNLEDTLLIPISYALICDFWKLKVSSLGISCP